MKSDEKLGNQVKVDFLLGVYVIFGKPKPHAKQ
jgi:hypothetical protein